MVLTLIVLILEPPSALREPARLVTLNVWVHALEGGRVFFVTLRAPRVVRAERAPPLY